MQAKYPQPSQPTRSKFNSEASQDSKPGAAWYTLEAPGCWLDSGSQSEFQALQPRWCAMTPCGTLAKVHKGLPATWENVSYYIQYKAFLSLSNKPGDVLLSTWGRHREYDLRQRSVVMIAVVGGAPCFAILICRHIECFSLSPHLCPQAQGLAGYNLAIVLVPILAVLSEDKQHTNQDTVIKPSIPLQKSAR